MVSSKQGPTRAARPMPSGAECKVQRFWVQGSEVPSFGIGIQPLVAGCLFLASDRCLLTSVLCYLTSEPLNAEPLNQWPDTYFFEGIFNNLRLESIAAIKLHTATITSASR